ncbi:hypothetical protein [Streptomyces koelreuteriae]|uniref:hypothetical protein n=1 Tax=Streptomyces koelreuteriae TaxID=2838015 RepID=UPI003EBD136A
MTCRAGAAGPGAATRLHIASACADGRSVLFGRHGPAAGGTAGASLCSGHELVSLLIVSLARIM